MIKAVSADKPLILDLLCRSFNNNKSVNFITGNKPNQEKRIYALMDYSFEVCRLFGEIWLSDNRGACALILYPQEKRTTIQSIWLDIKLIAQAVGLKGISRLLHREAGIKKVQPKIPMIYLWFIGVDPVKQRQGTGSQLLSEILADASQKRLPVYLETSTLGNLPWYESFGFEIYDQLVLDYTLFFLKYTLD
ncbi:MAG: GCN5-related N-acetyltransferase [Mucilaginibacter sp.]|nr:GCN5-related N-acetyltransferase [Mucilaginibacter sp.]